MFEKFGATELQKEKIKAFRTNYFCQLEQDKSKKYNPNNIFKDVNKTQYTSVEMSNSNTNTMLVEYKESFFTKFKNFIFKILHINK